MSQFDEPELLHTPLEKVVLEVRLLLSGFGSVSELLAQAISPPKPERIALAVAELYESGAITADDEGAAVTDFGKLAAGVPVDMASSKLIHLGYSFGCLPDAIVMAAAQSLQQDIFAIPSSIFLRDRQQYLKKLAANFAMRMAIDNGMYSEPLANLSVYMRWLQSRRTKYIADMMEINFARARQLDMTVAEICFKMIPLLEGCSNQLMRAKSERLRECAQRRGDRRHGDTDGIFCQDTTLLRVIVTGACAPRFLVGRIMPLKNIELTGFEANHTVVFGGIPNDLFSEQSFKAAIKYLNLNAERLHFHSSGTKVVVQLGAHPAEPLVESRGAEGGDALKQAILKDMGFSCKLAFQLFSSETKYRCVVPNPNFRPGCDLAEEHTISNVLADRLVRWHSGSCPSIIPYSRSPMGKICDFSDETVRYAVALSLEGSDIMGVIGQDMQGE
jgi:hypothetical protein